mmetsp:Transcript_93596/g.222513  ORF Transcript_93596/g.222513 Transcript_93596/m.222513 type:complete len:120 (+) Transcript_93596:419-778(+)
MLGSSDFVACDEQGSSTRHPATSHGQGSKATIQSEPRRAYLLLRNLKLDVKACTSPREATGTSYCTACPVMSHLGDFRLFRWILVCHPERGRQIDPVKWSMEDVSSEPFSTCVCLCPSQ